MRHRLRLATLLAILLVTGVTYGQTPPTASVQIRIPPEVQSDVWIFWAFLGDGGLLGHGGQMIGSVHEAVRTRWDVNDFSLPLGSARGLRVLIYSPGYQMVARDFTDAELTATTFVPPLAPLPTTRLDGRLVDSSNQPVRNQHLDITYSLNAAGSYFGYMDGPIPTISLGGTRTDETGAFMFDVPSFRDDPFLQQFPVSSGGQFVLSSDGNLKSGWRDDTLRPSSFSPEKTYQKPFVVVKVQHGIITGSFGKDFLEQNGATGDPTRYSLIAASADESDMDFFMFIRKLTADGTFEVQLPPGSYDLNLDVPGSGGVVGKKVSIEKGVIVEEGKRRIVQRP